MLLKNKLFNLVFFSLILMCSLFVITGCEKDSNSLDKQSMTQEGDLDYLLSQQSLGIWYQLTNEDQKILDIFTNIPENKFDLFFKGVASKFIDESSQYFPEEMQNQIVKDNLINFYIEVYKDINLLSKDKYHKNFNHLTKDEALNIIDNEYVNLLESAINNSDNKIVKDYWYNYMNAPSPLTLNELSMILF